VLAGVGEHGRPAAPAKTIAKAPTGIGDPVKDGKF